MNDAETICFYLANDVNHLLKESESFLKNHLNRNDINQIEFQSMKFFMYHRLMDVMEEIVLKMKKGLKFDYKRGFIADENSSMIDDEGDQTPSNE